MTQAPSAASPSDTAPAWLAHIAELLGAEASGMLTLHPDGQQSLLAVGHTDAATIAYRDHFHRLDPLSDLLAARPAGRALVIDTTTHPAYVERRELSQDYLRPHGIDHVAAAHWQEPDGTQRFVGIGQRRADSLGVGRAHVDAGMLNGQWIPAMRVQILGKGLQRAVISPRSRKQQAFGFKVMHNGDVFMSALDNGIASFTSPLVRAAQCGRTAPPCRSSDGPQ